MDTAYRRDREWFESLRRRFLDVAARRVAADDVEDIVQDAMRLVVEKGIGAAATVDGLPTLAWCFKVLRNVIGNYYQRESTRRRHLRDPDRESEPGDHGRVAEALDSAETVQIIERCLQEMNSSNRRCAEYLRQIVEGSSPSEIARKVGVEPATFYRRLYRCRRKLLELLESNGIDV